MEHNRKVKQVYKCDCCGGPVRSKINRSGEKLCKNCIEIRRCLRPFIEKQGLTVGQVLARAGKLLLPAAEQKKL